MPDTANPGMVLPATAAATNVLGVALTDAAPYGAPTSPLNIGAFTDKVAVAYGPADVDLVYTAACADGQLVIAGANGQVTPAAAGPASDQVVGKCTQPGGVAAGAAGRCRLR